MPNILSESPSFGSKKDKLKLNKILVVQDPFELAKNVARSVSKSNIGKCKPFLYIFIYQFGSWTVTSSFFTVHMLHKFRRGLEVLNQGLFIHELFDINNDEDEILLTSVKSQIEQEEVFRDIGLLGILNGV